MALQTNTHLPHQHGGELENILQKMPGEDHFADASGIFSNLCDATRLRILWILCHCEECVTNIAAAVGMSDPAVSHHLRVLKQSGLVISRRVGKEVHYTLAGTRQALLVHTMIDDVFEMNCPSAGIR